MSDTEVFAPPLLGIKRERSSCLYIEHPRSVEQLQVDRHWSVVQALADDDSGILKLDATAHEGWFEAATALQTGSADWQAALQAAVWFAVSMNSPHVRAAAEAGIAALLNGTATLQSTAWNYKEHCVLGYFATAAQCQRLLQLELPAGTLPAAWPSRSLERLRQRGASVPLAAVPQQLLALQDGSMAVQTEQCLYLLDAEQKQEACIQLKQAAQHASMLALQGRQFLLYSEPACKLQLWQGSDCLASAPMSRGLKLVAQLPDGSILAEQRKGLSIIDASLKVVKHLQSAERIWSAAVVGDRWVLCSCPNAMQIWDLQTEEYTLVEQPGRLCSSLCVLPDQKTVLGYGVSMRVTYVWQLQAEAGTLELCNEVSHARVSRAPALLLVDGSPLCVNRTVGRLETFRDGHWQPCTAMGTQQMHCVALLPSGRLAVADVEGVLSVWGL